MTNGLKNANQSLYYSAHTGHLSSATAMLPFLDIGEAKPPIK